jgi:hypothetical protein
MNTYGTLKVPELKEELKRRQLSVSGRKSELVSRLERDDQHPSAGPGIERTNKRKARSLESAEIAKKTKETAENAVATQDGFGEQVIFCKLIRDGVLRHLNPRKLRDVQYVLEMRCFKGLLSDVDLKEVFFQKMAGYAEKDFLLAKWREMSVEEMKQRVLDVTLMPGPGNSQNEVFRRKVTSLRTKQAVMREFGVLAYVPWQVYSQMLLGTEVIKSLQTDEGRRLLRETSAFIEGRRRAEVYLGYASLVSLDESVIVELIDEFGASDLSRACRFAAMNNHLSVIELLSKRYNADVHAGCLHNAASGGFLDLVVELVEKFGVDPNNRHFKDGGTALHYAADQGNLEAIRFIVEKYQVDVHVIDMYGDTALTVARRYSFGECAKLLRSYMGVTEEDDEPLNRGFPIGFPGFPFPFPIGPPPPAVGIEVEVDEGIVVQCGVM